MEVVTSDAHEGWTQAIQAAFPGSIWQRCQAHCSRNVLAKTLAAELEKQAPTVFRTVEDGWEDATAVLSLPKKYRRQICTSNMLERCIEEIRRRERVIRIFPNMDSCW